ncbi:MAG: hypothetical protein H6Q73_573 [Firmicutes bacterium]|nr:hypothetical protein [Bacillota bacterium]
MGIFDRIILTIYTIMLALLSLGVIVISLPLRLIPLELIGTSILSVYGHWEASLAGAVFFLVSIRLLLAGIRSRRNENNTIVHHNELGDVHISITAVENLVEKVARHVRGVRDVKVSAKHTTNGLRVNLKATVSPDTHIPTITAEMQQKIFDNIKNTIGVELADMRVIVENISNDFKAKHRVV